MNKQNRNKLNQTLAQWPTNGLRTAASLRAQGISNALLHHYVQRNWLKQVERGVYRRPNDAPDWTAALHLLQQEEKIPVHPGGLTAFELQGYGHYLGNRPLFLYAPSRTRLPAWFVRTVKHKIHFCPTNFLESAPTHSLQNVTVQGVNITISMPERAALELLYHVPRKFGFSEPQELIEGLATLRVELMQELLENCSSIKVKRLFLYYAREAGHSWYPALNRSTINLGSGKRELVKGGKLDKEFLLTVTTSFHPPEIPF